MRTLQLTIAAAMLAAPLAQADWLETFPSPGFDNPFTTIGLPLGSEGTATLDSVGGIGVLGASTPPAGSNGNPFSAPNGPLTVLSLNPSESFTDHRVAGLVNLDGRNNRDHGLVARASLGGGYVLGADFETTLLEGLYVGITDGTPGGTTVLDTVDLTALSLPATDSYFLELILDGNQLTGNVFGVDGAGAPTAVLGTVNATDTTFTSGFAGMIATPDNALQRIRGTFDNVSASALVPAVSAPGACLLLLAGLPLLRRFRR